MSTLTDIFLMRKFPSMRYFRQDQVGAEQFNPVPGPTRIQTPQVSPGNLRELLT